MVKITPRHIPTGKYKILSPQQKFPFLDWSGIPSNPLMTYSTQISQKQDEHNTYVTMKERSPPNNS